MPGRRGAAGPIWSELNGRLVRTQPGQAHGKGCSREIWIGSRRRQAIELPHRRWQIHPNSSAHPKPQVWSPRALLPRHSRRPQTDNNKQSSTWHWQRRSRAPAKRSSCSDSETKKNAGVPLFVDPGHFLLEVVLIPAAAASSGSREARLPVVGAAEGQRCRRRRRRR